jgi:cullin 3
MVINKCGGRLYDGLVATVSAHLSRVADAVERASGDALLRELKEAWDRHQKSMQMVRDILMYMDRIYVKHAGRVSRSWFLSTISTVVFLVSLAEV